MRRIFISGPITPRGKRTDTDHPAGEYIYNCHDMIKVYNALLAKGWAPYCPAFDFMAFLVAGSDLPVSAIYGADLEWLDVSGAIFMLPRWETTENCQREYSRAIELGMPIYMSLDEVPDGR